MYGFIALHRCLLDKPIWKNSTPEQKSILITLLLMVNHDAKEWEWKGEKFRAEPGQTITSLEKIAEDSGKGISIQNVRTALARFEKLEFLTNESTKTGRLITILNWGLYQHDGKRPNKEDNKDLTDDQQRPNKGLTPNNNDNKDNNDNKNKYSQTAKAIWTFYLENFNQIIKGKWTLTKERQSKITARLNDGYSEEQLKQAILNFRKSAWHIENNYFDIIHCFKNQTSCEKWVNGPADNKKDDWRF